MYYITIHVFFALKFDRRYRKDAYIKDLTIEYSLGFEKRCRVWKMDDFVSLEKKYKQRLSKFSSYLSNKTKQRLSKFRKP